MQTRGLGDGEAREFAAIGGVGAVRAEEKEPVEVGGHELRTCGAFHRSGHQSDDHSRLDETREDRLRTGKDLVLRGGPYVVGKVQEVLGIDLVELVCARVRPSTPRKVWTATCGSVSPAELCWPMSAGTPCNFSNAALQLRAPDPPVWTSVSSTSNSTTTGFVTTAPDGVRSRCSSRRPTSHVQLLTDRCTLNRPQPPHSITRPDGQKGLQ